MLNVNKNIDRGLALYEKYSQAITNYVIDRKNAYFKSKAYAGLRNRCRLNDDMIDNIYKTTQSFVSDVAPPIIRKAYKEFNAIFNKFLENDPLYSVEQEEGKSLDDIDIIQQITNNGLKRSEFRKETLPWLIDSAVRYGTFAAYSFATNDDNATSLMTITDPHGLGDYTQVHGKNEPIIVTTAIHPLNIIIDPRANWMVKPSYKGFIGDISIANLMSLKGNDNYIRTTLEEAIRLCKNGLTDKDWFGGAGYAELKDYSRGHTSITYMWTMLPIQGNEDDSSWYCVEVVGDQIIRIEQNALDLNTIPIATGVVIPRPYTWSGNTPLEDKIAIQNMMNWLINTEFMITAKMMDRIRLFREGELDIAAINSRHNTMGWVGYKGQEMDLSKLIYEVPSLDTSQHNMDWLVREMKQEDQETSALPNLDNRFGITGANKTLGAANMAQGIGEMLTGQYIKNINHGLAEIANQRLVLERAVSTEKINAGNGVTVSKEKILGKVKHSVVMSDFYNYLKALQEATNAITSIINWKATKIPEANGFHIEEFFENWARATAKRKTVTEFYDKKAAKAAVDSAAKQQPPQEKPSISISFKDMPPDAQAQLLKQIGIDAGPQSTISQLQVPQQQPLSQGGMNV